MASAGNRHCANCIGTLSLPMACSADSQTRRTTLCSIKNVHIFIFEITQS